MAVLPPEGNGFIAVFVCAIAFGIWRPDIRECFEVRAEDILEVVKLGVFLVFGAILTFDVLFEDGWAAVAIAAFTLLVARPVAVFAALAGSRQVDTAAKAFMAWFGPKGVATMTFALFVLGSAVPDAERITASPPSWCSPRSSPTGSRTIPARSGWHGAPSASPSAPVA